MRDVLAYLYKYILLSVNGKLFVIPRIVYILL